MLESLTLPTDVHHVRTTPLFTAATVPDGLLRAHRTARGVWGLVRVHEGTVTFISELTADARTLAPGDTQVIEPDTPHHVQLGPDAAFVIEFHR